MQHQVTALQKEGNTQYIKGRYDAARESYTRALALLNTEAESDREASCAPFNANETLWKSLMASQLFSNRAQTAIQERDFAVALNDANQALNFNENNEKALVRKLVALENLEKFEAALQFVDMVLSTGEKHSPTICQYFVAARRRLRTNLAKDRKVAASEVKQMGAMVHDKQQLRINFGSLLPSQIPLNQFFNVNVNISNEFGLFRREYMKNGKQIHLQCLLRNDRSGRYKLLFQNAEVFAGTGETGSVDTNGKIRLNERGRASFGVAIVKIADSSGAQVTTSSSLALEICAHEASRAMWNLLPVVSLPFSVCTSGGFREGGTGNLGVHCCRAVAIKGLGKDILLAESPGNLGIGGKLWDSCLVLARYLAARQELLVGKEVVELGSGIGLVGIFCSMLGARVTLTDMEEVIPLLDYNIRLNFPEKDQVDTRQKSSAIGASVLPVAKAHLWGEPPQDLPAQPDVLLLSDVVYDPEGYAPLVMSLKALAASPETLVLMAHRSRNPMEYQFFELLAQSFTYKQIDWLCTEKAAQSASSAGAEQALEDVKIFEIRRLAAQ